MTNKELWTEAATLLGEEELARRFRLWVTGLIKKNQQKRANMSASELFLEEAGKIIDHLNQLSNRRHTLTDAAKALIRGRMGEGFTTVDFFRVHEAMCKKWLGDEVMDANLRPSTLYRPSRFSEYLALWAPPAPPKPSAAGRLPEPGAPKKSSEQAMTPQKRQEIIAKVKSRPWHDFKTWAEFFLWTFQMPDLAALEEYDMPERIRRMRKAPMMAVNILAKREDAYRWAEEEYKLLKGKR